MVRAAPKAFGVGSRFKSGQAHHFDMAWVYILRGSSGRYYIGSTSESASGTWSIMVGSFQWAKVLATDGHESTRMREKWIDKEGRSGGKQERKAKSLTTK
jgi:hypothetical protein